MTGTVQSSVGIVLSFVLHRDIGRIADDDVIALAENLLQCLAIFRGIDRRNLEEVELLEQAAFFGPRLGLLPKSRLSPVARLMFQPGARFKLLIPQACTAATINRK